MRYFAPALILVFALAGCVSPAEKTVEEARADSLAQAAEARARAQAEAQAKARAQAEARAKAQATRAKAQATRAKARAQNELKELVAQAFEAQAEAYSNGSEAALSALFDVMPPDMLKARDARRDYQYALAMAANAENNAALMRLIAGNATADKWRAFNEAAAKWERVADALEALETM